MAGRSAASLRMTLAAGLALALAAWAAPFPASAQEAPALTAPLPQPAAPDELPAPATPAAADAAPGAPVPAQPLAAPGATVTPAMPDLSPAEAEDTDLRTIVLHAHPVVQGTMALLAAMVFAVVTIFLFKMTEMAVSDRRLGRGFRRLAAARSLADLGPVPAPGPRRASEPTAAMLRAVGDELAELPAAIGRIEAEGLNERLGIAFDRIEAAAIARLRAGTGALPQIASTAPFIGLFGTVFGIMNAFLAIADTGTTSLAVVAPGIAEALLATAIGLVAAIPAVIVHNLLQRRITSHRQRIDDVAAMAARLVSHDMTARRLAGRAAGLD